MTKKHDWTVEQVSHNVHTIRFKDIKKGWSQRIMISGDRHHDNKHTDHKLEKEHLDRARDYNAPILDVGDLFCAMQGKFDKRASQSDLRAEHRGDNYFDLLLDEATSFYGPYADLFAVIAKGNHDKSILKHHQIGLIHNLSKRLQAESKVADRAFAGGYAGWVLLRFHVHGTKQQTLRIKYHHGYGGGGPVTKGVIQTNRRAVYLPDADIVASGHIHEAWVVPIKRERINDAGTVGLDTQWHVSTPTYKEEYLAGEGFHVERGSPPKPLGCAWLHLSYRNGRIVPRVELELA